MCVADRFLFCVAWWAFVGKTRRAVHFLGSRSLETEEACGATSACAALVLKIGLPSQMFPRACWAPGLSFFKEHSESACNVVLCLRSSLLASLLVLESRSMCLRCKTLRGVCITPPWAGKTFLPRSQNSCWMQIHSTHCLPHGTWDKDR